MIDLSINKEKLAHNVQVARENHIILPTFAQMRDPQKVPEKVKKALKNVGLWDVNPLNLFRITWHNEPTMEGGQYGGVNFIELPSVLTGVKARIIVLCGGRVVADGARDEIFAQADVAERVGIRPPEIFSMAQALDRRAMCYTIDEFLSSFQEV